MLCQRVGDELGQQARCQRDAPERGVRPSAEPSSGMPSVDEAGFMDYEVDAVGRAVGVVRSNLLVTYTIMLAIEYLQVYPSTLPCMYVHGICATSFLFQDIVVGYDADDDDRMLHLQCISNLISAFTVGPRRRAPLYHDHLRRFVTTLYGCAVAHCQ